MLRDIVKILYKYIEKFYSILVHPPNSHLKPFLNNRELYRLTRLPRKRSSSTNLFGQSISFPDGAWFLHSLNEIFLDEVYMFKSVSCNPMILDCGANIGLSVIYFKRLYPSSRIIAFEPDQNIFRQLDDNVSKFNFSDVQLINKGVWSASTELSFLAEGTLGGKVIEEPYTDKSKIITIKTVRLKDYLNQKIDFLKIDIEGAELEVLIDCAERLGNVDYLFVEYHSKPESIQKLDEILRIITNAGFRYYVKEADVPVRYPFIDPKGTWFDLQLNIFCYR